MTENKVGLGSLRKKRTSRPDSFVPNQSEDDKRTTETVVLKSEKKKLTSKDLPKSIRLPLETHAAINTISTIEDAKIYETVNKITEFYIQSLTPAQRKIVKNSVQAVLETSRNKEV
ncbi:hypothetical protein [Latilactobacillus graminis]|uniref:Uncharacterized protein n=1 Tax=Latilactobacillus graminis DSM 20719 TaxID=1423752 RepID=A0AA89I2J0_9LACO|nr:hypothetical protein [Latilactobacillus graminis]KRM22685.1 hypothetical protein FC90_GL000785 [Latilactobacillus graminis DSM 20719]